MHHFFLSKIKSDHNMTAVILRPARLATACSDTAQYSSENVPADL